MIAAMLNEGHRMFGIAFTIIGVFLALVVIFWGTIAILAVVTIVLIGIVEFPKQIWRELFGPVRPVQKFVNEERERRKHEAHMGR
jgi:hypothetical protein